MSEVQGSGSAAAASTAVATAKRPDAADTSVPSASKAQANSTVVDTDKIEQNREITESKVVAAVEKINQYLQRTQRDLQFSVDGPTGRTVVQVLDRSNNEMIRQVPDETVLRIAQQIQNEEPLTLLSAYI